VILALAVSHPAAAQASAPSPAAAAAPTTSFAPTTSLAPTLAATHLGFSAVDHAPLTVNASAASMGAREGKAVAIVGAAVVVIGLVVGGDSGTLITIGGAGLGLFGLYIWQRGD
jgi:hypothetical protein